MRTFASINKTITTKMNVGEYAQMKAFARVDGVLVALVWTASFAFYVAGLAHPALMMVAMLVGLASPVYAGKRLCHYRDGVLGGELSFRRGYAYTALVFLYAALLFAVVQFVYFRFLDNGFVASCLTALTSNPEAMQALKASGMESAFNDALAQMVAVRPIDYALSYFTTNVALGLMLGLPIAGVVSRGAARAQ